MDQNEQAPPSSRHGVAAPLVGIGASAGGLGALSDFFDHCRSDAGLAYLVVQHLAPSGKSALPEILGKQSPMPVSSVADGMSIEADHIYVLPPNRQVTVEDNHFHTHPLEGAHPNLIIDLFFESMADAFREHAIGIVLSGTGTDGMEGSKHIRERGGIVMVQDPKDAEYGGMPEAIIRAGAADRVLPARDLAEQVAHYVRHAPEFQPEAYETGERPAVIDKIINLLGREHNDFSRYKEKTIVRRVYRRMGLNHVSDAERYFDILSSNPEERTRLYRDCLISVTAFFRDTAAMDALQEQVLARLANEATGDREIRIWVAGCATGEEAYSVAILLDECLERAQKSARVQIFATDLDEEALEIARQGIYPGEIQHTVSNHRLTRYFSKEGASYRIKKELREQIVFAYQNLITSPPFSHIDLISCRNLLIYLKLDVQNQVMELFHFALRENGYLFLGPSETIGRKTELFRTGGPAQPAVSAQHDRPPQSAEFALHLHPRHGGPDSLAVAIHTPRGVPPPNQRTRPAPPACPLCAARRPGHREWRNSLFRGRNLDLSEAASRRTESAAVRSDPLGRKGRASHRVPPAPYRKTPGSNRTRSPSGAVAPHTQVVLIVSPITFGEETHYLVVFEGDAARGSSTPVVESDGTEHESSLVHQLEDEINAMRAELQSVIEDRETSTQELKVSHEEALSMNEELQSANEELETSKEELQSLNEEMNTVNSELQNKVDQLDHAYSDLDNLLKSSTAATVFLDCEFHIRLFTPNCREIFRLASSDVGRPLDDINPNVDDPHLFDDLRSTMDTMGVSENEVRTKGEEAEAHWYLRRVSPYRTSDDSLAGLVITYADITRLKASEEELCRLTAELEERVRERTQALRNHIEARKKATRERDAFFELSSIPFFIADRNNRFVRLNPAWEECFGWALSALYKASLTDFIHPDDVDEFARHLGALNAGLEARAELTARLKGKDDAQHTLKWEVRRDELGFLFGAVREVAPQP